MNKKTNRKGYFIVLMAVILPMSLAGCKGKARSLSDTSLDRPLNIGIVGDACELHFYAAQMLGLYEKAGYQVNWIHTMDLALQLAAGKLDVTDGVLDQCLKPIEQGLDIKITTALQQGCMGLLVPVDSPYYTLADLKGKKIGAQGTVGAGTSAYLWRLLIKQGIDPLANYEWLGFDVAAAFLAYDKGNVDAVGMPDTLTWPMVKSGNSRYISRLGTDPELAHQTCCTLNFNTKFTEQYPGATKKITEILIEAVRYTEANREEVIRYGYHSGLIIQGTIEDSIELTAGYKWEPGYKLAVDTFRDIFEDYQKVNIIDKNINVDKVINKVFIKYDDID